MTAITPPPTFRADESTRSVNMKTINCEPGARLFGVGVIVTGTLGGHASRAAWAEYSKPVGG